MGDSKLTSYLDTVLVPVVRELKDHPALAYWEVMNGPEGSSPAGQTDSTTGWRTPFIERTGRRWCLPGPGAASHPPPLLETILSTRPASTTTRTTVFSRPARGSWEWWTSSSSTPTPGRAAGALTTPCQASLQRTTEWTNPSWWESFPLLPTRLTASPTVTARPRWWSISTPGTSLGDSAGLTYRTNSTAMDNWSRTSWTG